MSLKGFRRNKIRFFLRKQITNLNALCCFTFYIFTVLNNMSKTMPHGCPCTTGATHDYTEKLVCHWQRSMREFSDKHKEKCKNSEPGHSVYVIKDFPTGSSYDGGYEDMQMRGYGEYTFPNGVLYRGEFENGVCHGDGELIYKDDPEHYTIISGCWEKGTLENGKIQFNGILEYDSDEWQYCKMPDRRYSTEFHEELQPAGKSNITAEQPPREIPPGFLDSGYGFYNPETEGVYKYENVLEVAKGASRREQSWIEDNCRMEPMRRVGARPDLYETWLEPDVDPQPLHKKLSTYAPIAVSSLFEKVEAIAKPFYDSKNHDHARPPREFQPPENKDK